MELLSALEDQSLFIQSWEVADAATAYRPHKHVARIHQLAVGHSGCFLKKGFPLKNQDGHLARGCRIA